MVKSEWKDDSKNCLICCNSPECWWHTDTNQFLNPTCACTHGWTPTCENWILNWHKAFTKHNTDTEIIYVKEMEFWCHFLCTFTLLRKHVCLNCKRSLRAFITWVTLSGCREGSAHTPYIHLVSTWHRSRDECSQFFTTLPLPCVIVIANKQKKIGVGLGTRLAKEHTYTCS